jgi:F-type H+-transporting ATPase subunit gamma
MKKAQQAALASRPYAQLMGSMLAALSSRVDESFHPFLAQRPVKTRGILLVSTDKGLCGPLNSNLFRLVAEIKTPAKFYAIGRKGSQFLARTKRDMVADFQVTDRVPFADVKVIVQFMIKQFLEGVIDTIEVIYPRYKNTLVQESIVRPVLPLLNLRAFLSAAQSDAVAGSAGTTDDREISFEPNAQQVLEALLPFYVDRVIYQFILSAKASEHSARMVAMKTAKDNATKILGELTLEYNKARQAAITQEILEIAASAFATA